MSIADLHRFFLSDECNTMCHLIQTPETFLLLRVTDTGLYLFYFHLKHHQIQWSQPVLINPQVLEEIFFTTWNTCCWSLHRQTVAIRAYLKEWDTWLSCVLISELLEWCHHRWHLHLHRIPRIVPVLLLWHWQGMNLYLPSSNCGVHYVPVLVSDLSMYSNPAGIFILEQVDTSTIILYVWDLHLYEYDSICPGMIRRHTLVREMLFLIPYGPLCKMVPRVYDHFASVWHTCRHNSFCEIRYLRFKKPR